MLAKAPKTLLLVAVWLAAGMSVLRGLRGAVDPDHGGHDFQWSPASLLSIGENPYAAYLMDTDQIIMWQAPNYLHILYFVLLPLGVLSFGTAKVVWATLNVAMLAAAGIVLARACGLSPYQGAILLGLFACATPFATTISAGQTTALVLLCALVAFSRVKLLAGLGLAVSISKYSFAPPLLIGMLLRNKWREVVYAVAASVVAIFAFSAITDTSVLATTLQPLRVSRIATGDGVADIMTLTPVISGIPSASVFAYLVAIGLFCVLTWTARRALRHGEWLDALSCAAIISLLCFKHLIYDFCFLLPVVFTALRMHGARRPILLMIVGYFWYGPRLLGSPGSFSDPGMVVLSFFLLLAAFVLTVTNARPGVDKTVSPARTVVSPNDHDAATHTRSELR